MIGLRVFRARRRGWLAFLLACTLAMRLVVPAGFMPVAANGRLVLQLCSGMASPAATEATMPGMDHRQSGNDKSGRTYMPCAFAGLGLAALGAVDPVLLVAAILFAFMLASLAIVTGLPAPPHRLRPPLRAPPLAA